MLFRDTPANRIEDPVSFLEAKYPGRSFELQSQVSLADRVPPYYIFETNACALYGISSMLAFHMNRLQAREGGAAGLASSSESGPGAITAGSAPSAVTAGSALSAGSSRPAPGNVTAEALAPRIMQIFREKLDPAPSLGDFTLDNIDYTFFSRLCIRSLSLPLIAVNSFSRSRGLRELAAGRPFLLNIWYSDAGGYFNHSVVCCGSAEFKMTGSGKSFRFWQVRDGYTLDPAPRWTMLSPNPVSAYITVFSEA